MSSSITYADVLLPLALPQNYTYAIPFDLVPFVKVGHRIIVQFGKNKFYTAIVKRIHHEKPVFEPKLLESLADEHPIVTENQLRLWKWMSDYYLCTEGEVMQAALPAGLKLSSETKIILNEFYEGDYESLNNEEFLIVQALREQRETTVPQIQDMLQRKNVYPYLRTLFNLGIALSSEEVIEKFKPKTETYVRLYETYQDEENLKQLYGDLERAPKQLQLLLAFNQLSLKNRYVKKNELLALSQSDAATLKRLADKKIFQEYKVEVSRLGTFHEDDITTANLSEDQQRAIREIDEHFQDKNTVLLHGVTSSGKTQVYIEKMAEAIREGKQVLYMLPEIALTAQIINRLRKYFGNQIGIYHSKFNQNERVEIWNKVLNGEYKLVVSARSGLFLPFRDLGLVIVDEEHDNSFKQMDPNPRYNARDISIMLARYFDGKVILGSATPSLESYQNAERGKYGLVEMTKRYGDVSLPQIVVEDIKRERRKMTMHHSFTQTLTVAIQEVLANKEQAILFINRRGFSQYQTCRTCGFVYKCRNCDVSLTYHKFQNKLICHYCGYLEPVGRACKSCGTIDLDIVGMGTERIEEEIAELFPEARVGRLDLDTTRGKHGHSTVIASFENREVDILVGTQMVTKGLDFEHVSLVGIVNADHALYFPGFRSNERAFQVMMQVGGRAGRKQKQGKVIIQTSNPQHRIIKQVVEHDFASFYRAEMQERQQFHYPPYSRMVHITLRHKEVAMVEKAVLFLANNLRKKQIGETLGPTTPLISKVRNYYLRDIIIKTDHRTNDLQTFKLAIKDCLDMLRADKELKSVWISVDVDP
ncbi:MAG: primosomal protein N' [Bacteroidetes bacterium]|nr:primosomal protein N' [Bacteroidota bacterium]